MDRRHNIRYKRPRGCGASPIQPTRLLQTNRTGRGKVPRLFQRANSKLGTRSGVQELPTFKFMGHTPCNYADETKIEISRTKSERLKRCFPPIFNSE